MVEIIGLQVSETKRNFLYIECSFFFSFSEVILVFLSCLSEILNISS
jgi:hypothetical protein